MSRRVRRLPRAAHAVLLFALLALLVPSIVAPGAAEAATPGGVDIAAEPVVEPAPGTAFDPQYPQVFIGQGFPPTVLLGGQQAPGALALAALGSTAGISYNAIGFNVNDGFIYGIQANTSAATDGTNHLVRIGRGGVAVDLGEIEGLPEPKAKPTTGNRVNTYTQGTFGGIPGPEGNSHLLYIRDYNNTDNENKLWVVNVETQSADQVTFTAGSKPISGVADFTWVGGQEYLGDRGSMFGASATKFFQITEIEGGGFAVRSYPNPITQMAGTGRQFGAAWTLGNGLLGFSDNTTGEVFVVEVFLSELVNDEPGLGFRLAARFEGPATQNNDGTSAPGGDVDLGIVKIGPANYAVGDTLDYTMLVTNHGPHPSSGSILTDTPPEELDEVTTTTDGCTVDDRTLTCVLGALAVGASTQVQMSATVVTPTTDPGGRVLNGALITGNEHDPNDSNNWSTTAADPYPPVLERAKSSIPVSGTQVTVGDLVSYELTFHNPGRVPVQVDQVDRFADVADDADLEGPVVAQPPLTVVAAATEMSITGTLAPGATATVRYAMRVNDPLPDDTNGVLGNFLVTRGETPPSTCDPTTRLCTTHPLVGTLTWNKVDGETPAVALAGSEWTLTRYDGAATPAVVPSSQIVVTDCVAESDADCTGADRDPAQGGFHVRDLPIGTYQLAETHAPAGYQQIQPIDIRVVSNVDYGDIVNIPVEGPTLPLTGGMGTSMFWALTGGSGVLAVAALFLQRRRMRA
ncbi:DUF6923 family protein [Microbacterium caowuchunii]|uniref:DUF11 domain-containing protein n=1 Tax=Microbacterium caowuchunii TaxID=2614638 RepID=A0A5N0TBD9_9MICO|nr:SpaA isopeptide-forming pilin-related protein [Microbacterium caowuchunii]KAA9132403.1 DUF11 domain-containing protein [Microbacterium caowuchunii]